MSMMQNDEQQPQPVPPAGVVPPARELAETPAERWDRETAEADARLEELASITTQRQWLNITRALDRTRNQIGADAGLSMLAMLWVQESNAHGGASWPALLDLTDRELEDRLGYPAGERPED